MNADEFIRSDEYEIAKQNELVIILKDIHALPLVYHNGEMIELKQYIHFHWNTSNENHTGVSEYQIAHYNKDKKSHEVKGNRRTPWPHSLELKED